MSLKLTGSDAVVAGSVRKNAILMQFAMTVVIINVRLISATVMVAGPVG